MKARLTDQQLEHAGDGYDPVAPGPPRSARHCYIEPEYLEVEASRSSAGAGNSVPRGEAARARQLCRRPRPGSEHRRDPRRGRRVARLLQCLQAPRTRAAEGRRHDEASSPVRTTPGSTISGGRLHRARRSELIENFDPGRIFLTPVQVEVFCHLVFVNLDPQAPALGEQTDGLAREVGRTPPTSARSPSRIA